MIRRQGNYRSLGAFVVVAIAAALWVRPAVAADPALADEAADQPAAAAAPGGQQLQEVTVSASAISIAGYEAPTPVNVIGLQQLQTEAQPDIGDTIRELPQFGGSSSPNNQVNSTLIVAGTAGLDLVSLRNLGQNRTLVLFDGQRVLASNIRGGVDMSTVPSTLVERVDVVTGGASAVWGSDAVAGVVNLIINKNFNGAAVNVEYGNDWMGPQHSETRVDLTLGTPFADGRGHIEFAGSYWDSPNAVFGNEQVGNAYQKLVNNPACTNLGCPAGQPQLITVNNGGLYGFTQGGAITGMTGAGAALNNIQFVGPNGTPAPYNVSNVTGGLYASGPSVDFEHNNQNLLTIPLKDYTAFALASYDITDNLKASVQLNYGNSQSENDTYADYWTYFIPKDNAYLQQILAQNPAFATAYTAAGSPTLNVNTMNSNNNVGGAYTSLSQLANTLGGTVNLNYRRLERGVFNLDGKIGDNWSWNAYYQACEVYVNTHAINNANYNFAINAADAVYVTPANVGASGLPIGSITCRSNLTGATTNCAPLDIFGNGVASPEAINYIQSSARSGGDQQWSVFTEQVIKASAQGTLPFGLPAGNVATAFGAVYRNENGDALSTPLSSCHCTFPYGNFSNFSGEYNVKEGYMEVNAPILKDMGVKSLNLDAAARATDYSTSGYVTTYKFGLVTQIVDQVALRAVYSRDIRAPDLQELFSPGTLIAAGSLVNPFTHVLTPNVFNLSGGGNKKLVPEQGTTKTIGVVITPIPSLNVSLDWYDIVITDAIDTFGTNTILAQCAAGNSIFCQSVVVQGSCPNCTLKQVNEGYINADVDQTSGFDVSADYHVPFMAGNLAFHLSSNYTFSETFKALGQTYDFANCLGLDCNTPSYAQGMPKFKGLASGTYAQGPWTFTLQGRFIGAAQICNCWVQGVNVDHNDVPFIKYMDVRASYKVGDHLTVFGAVDNLTGTAPPEILFSANIGDPSFTSPIRDDIYDYLGRQYRVGLRARF